MSGLRNTATAFLIGVFTFAGVARADFIFNSASHSVTALTHGYEGDPVQTLSTTQLDPWNQTAYIHEAPPRVGWSSQQLESQLLATGISIKTNFDAMQPGYVGTGYAWGSATSEIAFKVATNQNVQLDVTLNLYDRNLGGGWFPVSNARLITLTRAGIFNQPPTTVLSVGTMVNQVDVPQASGNWQSGTTRSFFTTLQAGRVYTLNVQFDSLVGPGWVGTNTQFWAADAEISLHEAPEPAAMGLLLAGLPLLMRRRRSADIG